MQQLPHREGMSDLTRQATSNAGLTYTFRISKGTRGYYVFTRDHRVNVDFGPYATLDVAEAALNYVATYMATTGTFPRERR